MKKPALAGLGVLGLLALVSPFFARRPSPAMAANETSGLAAKRSADARPFTLPIPAVAAVGMELRRQPSMSERTARADKVLRDYEAIRSACLREFGAEGEVRPESSLTLLRELALLEREKHADLARILTPRELENVELRDTTAGQLVQRKLGHSAASDKQRRAVFRLRRQFDLEHGAPTDCSPESVAEREEASAATSQQIHSVLGDALFSTWVQSGATDSGQPGDG